MTALDQNAQRGICAIVDAAGEPNGPLAKATACVGGLADRLALAHTTRNIDPDGARTQLVAALAVWPVVCRVMAELERAAPALATEAGGKAEAFIALLDQRDGRERA